MDIKPESRFKHELIEDYNDGDCIFAEGETGRDLYIVQAGVVSIRKSTPQGDIEIIQFKKGDFFGDMALLQSLPRYAGAFAMGPTRLLILKPAGFLLKIRRDPTFAFEMLQQMSFRVKFASDRVLELVHHYRLPVEEVQKVINSVGG
ncbi:MAG: Crp/Fnr family transcriptional regulator [Bdellovibrionaceae bacterium]|nr:Crp/Fnr family transcriptional regulator [Pseudobdellovibrionaceae bacterium]